MPRVKLPLSRAPGDEGSRNDRIADPPDGKPDVLLLATGSEVWLCIDAYEELYRGYREVHGEGELRAVSGARSNSFHYVREAPAGRVVGGASANTAPR